MASVPNATIERRRILIRGIVQGVGFRPFVYGQALGRALVGFVQNDSAGVTIEIEGPADVLDDFQRALRDDLPPLARVDSINVETIVPCHDTAFIITHSRTEATRNALIAPDTVTCDDCLRELFDPADRRYGYPFINCTNCGPRFTIVQDVPYDRDKTTMRVFPMCAACQAEYDDPLNRRFHAQPNACPVCGPQVSLIDFTGSLPDEYEDENPVAIAARALANGVILTVKGLGGYHLACDALNTEAVQRLRQRKHREAKPFALMVADMETARQLCYISGAEEAVLRSRQRPVVLLQRRSDCPVASGVAPVHDTLGIMLPYTPLHHLLLHSFAENIAPERLAVLVMTSGNVSDEPIAYCDDDARERLHTTADAMLTHNREIHMRCDDSVTRIVTGGQQLFRRSRGYVPEPVSLAFELPAPVLACGSHLKNTFCLGKERQAFVGHHIGDLENLETLTSFREGIEHFQRLFDISPAIIAYDLHPEYLATKYALDSDIPRKIGVQHHHAHIASVMAEHGLTGPVIGVAADGTGYGTDGAVWGGEVMVADFTGFERLAHLAYMPLPGGEQAIHQPWRVAAAYLQRAYGDDFLNADIPFTQQLDRAKWHVLRQMIAKNINCPQTSSMGRLFDAVAALLGVRAEVLYEGQAAIELEILANQANQANQAMNSEEVLYPFAIEGQLLDVMPTIRAIVSDMQRGISSAQIALRFHHTIAELLATTCSEARKQTGLHIVALSGGVFQNRLLLERLIARLETMAFQVYINRRVPPNDGGISLGQLAIAASIGIDGKLSLGR